VTKRIFVGYFESGTLKVNDKSWFQNGSFSSMFSSSHKRSK